MEAAAAATATVGRDGAAAAKNGGEEAGETIAAVADKTRGRSLSRKRVAVRRRRPQTQ